MAQETKAVVGGGNKLGTSTTAVMKVDMHCRGCTDRIRASVRGFPGVEGVTMDVVKGTMTVVGRFDTKKMRDRVAKKTKKKVDLIPDDKKKGGGGGGSGDGEDEGDSRNQKGSSEGVCKPCKDEGQGQRDDKGGGGGNKKGGGGGNQKGGGGNQKGREDGERKADRDEEKNDEKCRSGDGGGGDNAAKGKDKGSKGKDSKAQDSKKSALPVVATVILKIGAGGLHCDGCMDRIRAKLMKIKGVEQVSMELSKNQATVTGTMDVKALPEKLRKKLRRPVDVVPPLNKKQDGKDKDKQQQDGGGKDKCKCGCGWKQHDVVAAALIVQASWTCDLFEEQAVLTRSEFILSDENPGACAVM